MITDWLAGADEKSRVDTLQCMSPNGQKTLYSVSPEAEWLSEEELNCIWEGVRSIWTSTTEPGIPEVHDRGQLATEIVRAYCINKKGDTARAAYINDPAISTELAAMYCMVDTIGGPAEFTAWMVQDPWALFDIEAAVRGEGKCGMVNQPVEQYIETRRILICLVLQPHINSGDLCRRRL